MKKRQQMVLWIAGFIIFLATLYAFVWRMAHVQEMKTGYVETVYETQL